MKKYDKEYLEFLEMFQEYCCNDENEIPEIEDFDEYEDESVWIIKRIRCRYNERIREEILGAFETKAEAECYLRRIKHDLDKSHKCYGSKDALRAYLRMNKVTNYIYEIQKVDFIK